MTAVTKGFEELAGRKIYGLQLPSLVLTQEQVRSDRDTKKNRDEPEQAVGPFGEAVS